MMRKHAVLLNCSRGKVIDNQALFKALSEDWIASAGLDDTEEEPAKMDSWSPDMNPLFTLDNCITPLPFCDEIFIVKYSDGYDDFSCSGD